MRYGVGLGDRENDQQANGTDGIYHQYLLFPSPISGARGSDTTSGLVSHGVSLSCTA